MNKHDGYRYVRTVWSNDGTRRRLALYEFQGGRARRMGTVKETEANERAWFDGAKAETLEGGEE